MIVLCGLGSSDVPSRLSCGSVEVQAQLWSRTMICVLNLAEPNFCQAQSLEHVLLWLHHLVSTIPRTPLKIRNST